MFETPLFWALLLITAASFHITSNEQYRIRAATLAIGSIMALAFVVKLQPAWILFLVGLSVWIVVGLKWTRSLAGTSPYLASFLVFLPVLIPWVLGKQAVALEWSHLSILYFVGFSFFLIKAWTLVRDYHSGLIEQVDPLVVVAYFLFFPAYIAGPMHFYGEFDQTIRRPLKLDGVALVDAVFRILLGLVKIKLVSALLLPVSLEAVRESGVISLRRIVVGSFVYSLVIWANFSGYSDLAIASSRAAGIYTPENFNYPYAARNVRDFWQRWHLTFSRVLMSYVFVPLSRKLQAAFKSRSRAVPIVATLLTFLFCGYWHGPTLNFLLWGLYHGLGIIAYDLYRRGAGRRRQKRNGKTQIPYAEPLGRAVGVALTFSFVSLGWIFFVLPTAMIFRR
jgi:alginate O-acetyltransferase complex protein AlgI